MWFAATTIEAQRQAIADVEFIISKTRFLDGLRSQINERQEKALLRMLREGTGGFKGGLSAANYPDDYRSFRPLPQPVTLLIWSKRSDFGPPRLA